MNHLILRNKTIENTHIEKLHLITDDEGNVIFLPLLWTIHLSNTCSVYGWHTTGEFSSRGSVSRKNKLKNVQKTFEARNISENTMDNYVGHVFHLLKYINEISHKKTEISVHHTELTTSKFLNYYLNDILSKRLNSRESLVAHQAAISSYFNFLYSINIKDYMATTIYRKALQYMAEKDVRPKKINYICRNDRVALLDNCRNKRDRLIIRMGYEIGLRSEENTGLVLGSHKAKKGTHCGLLELFSELEQSKSKNCFEFVLNGRYTKGGRTRNIYFNRELLTALYNYYKTERKEMIHHSENDCPTLFIRHDHEGRGLPISASQASTVFRKLKILCPNIQNEQSYHDLRHSFATELYHAELHDSEGSETRSESAALIVVGERMGHSPGSSATKRYIRLRTKMLALESNDNG